MTKHDATTPPLCLANLERFAAPGVVASFDALALGAFTRLLSHSWNQEPPCSLPADDRLLAGIARTTAPGEWERVKPSLLLAFVPEHQLPDPAQGNRTRLVNAVARAIFDQLAAEAAAFSEMQSRKSRARWHDKGRPDPNGMPPGSRRDASGMPPASAPSLRSESPSLSLHRSSLANESDRSSGRSEGEGDVLGQLGERARAIEDEKIAEWRREHALDLLQKAIVDWREQGLTRCPVTKASEIARGPWSEPARVQAVIEDAKARVLEGGMGNPVGFLLCGLGLAPNRRGITRPAEIPLLVARAWAEKEAGRRKTLKIAAAVLAVGNASRTSQPGNVAQAGGA